MNSLKLLLFSIVVVLFGGFVLVGETMAFSGDEGYWIMISGLILGVVGLLLPEETPLNSLFGGG